jgi:hypothetical protein
MLLVVRVSHLATNTATTDLALGRLLRPSSNGTRCGSGDASQRRCRRHETLRHILQDDTVKRGGMVALRVPHQELSSGRHEEMATWDMV